MRRLLFLAISTVLILSSCSQSHDLVKDGKSDYKIFVSDKAIAPEKYAAGQLQTYLYEISGCKIDITHQAVENGKLIYIGFKDAPSSMIENLKPADFGNEEYMIRSDGNNLLIAGGDTRGTLYGVMGYLSDYLGCRWFTREVAKIPSQPTIALSKIEDRQKPAFEYRDMDWRESLDTTWVIHNRLNGMRVGDSLGGNYITYPFVHTFYQLVSPEKYFHSHPEYFSEVNGKRIGENGQLCLTNPDVVKVATATVFDWIKTHPKASVFSIDQNDGEGYCKCKNCRALDEKEGSHAGTLLAFVNQIADTVAKVYPKVKLQTLAYAYTVVPPKNIRPADNVLIRLCHYEYCAAHPIESCVINKPFLNQLDQWKQIAKGRITIWDYYTDFRNYLMPYPNFGSFSHDIKFYVDNGVKGLFAEGDADGGGEFAELRSWVIAQLMWHPDQDAQQLIKEFIDNVYGKAAEYIASYIQLLQKQITPDTHLSIWAEPYDVNYLNRSTIQKSDSLFALARKAASGDTALSARVELAYLPVLYTKLYSFSQGGTAYIDRQNLPDALHQFNELVSRYHITGLGADTKTYGSMEGFLNRIQLATISEFYTDWWVIGPFDNTDHKGLYKIFPPEQGFDSTQEYAGANGKKLLWKKYDDNTTGYIDFNSLFGSPENVVAYARRIITLPEDKTIKFGVGNNDGIRIWINGKLVFDRATAAIGPNQNTFSIKLNKGENTVLVKVDQLRHGWGFYLSKMDDTES
jgi:hypothetical protein